MLSRHPGKCRRPHGHSRAVDIVVEADELDENGMVLDFKALKAAAEDLVTAYDHALCVNSTDPHYPDLVGMFGDAVIAFENLEPTTENLARRLYDELDRKLQQPPHSGRRLKLLRVRISETSATWAEYGEG